MKPTRVFIDTTQTYYNDLQTGIQRVATHILKEMQTIPASRGLESHAVVNSLKRFHIVSLQQRKAGCGHKLTTLLKRLYTKIGIIPKLLLPCGVRARLIRLNNRFSYALSALAGPEKVSVEFEEGDVLLLAEAGWLNPCWKASSEARKKGARIIQIVYDLIPVKHPEFMHSESARLFRDWLVESRKYVDAYICDSEFVAEELKAFLRQHEDANAATCKIEHFVLGADIEHAAAHNSIRAELRNILSDTGGRSGYLCIGIIDLRKNQAYLLDAFEEIWKQCPTAKLIIVGRMGWKGQDIARRLAQHPMLNKSLFVFHDLSDTELAYCYERCKALVFPTLAEGFGLPVVEALSKGLPVFASDLEVLREAGKDFCTYFDVTDSRSLAKTILDIETRNQWPAVRDISEFKATTWRDSCEQLLDKIEQCCDKDGIGN